MRLSLLYKLLFISLIIFCTYLYAVWQKQKYYSNDQNHTASLVLKDLPSFGAYTLDGKKFYVNSKSLVSSRGVFIHLWATWCGPCATEMPEFLSFAEKTKNKNVKFYLIAVGDDLNSVKKFLRRFQTIPENVTIGLDLDNSIMDLFGTLKVPETFLFNSAGKHINKFVGPQEWSQESYISRLDFWLNAKNN